MTLSKPRFAVSSEQEKAHLMEIWKAKSTNNATKLWIDTLRQYLEHEEMPKLENIDNTELPNILESFYVSVHTKKSEKYKSTTLHAMRAGLNR